MKNIPALQDLVSSEIDRLYFGDHPAELYEPISYILSLGGKRMRPLLVLLGYQLAKDDPERVIRPALAVEVFHNFTLMHDDIMDGAPLRRGKPTVHQKWNDAVAILSGDTMLVKAYELLLEVEPAILAEAIRRFNQTAVAVCEGQQIDMEFESRDHVGVDEYIEMIRLKTGVLLGFSLEFGALMAGIGKEQRKLIYDIGVYMGIGFQLMDDLLDVYGDQAKFGKQVGGDIVANKKTYLLIKALESANLGQREEVMQWIGKKQFVADKKIEAIKNVYDQLKVREQTTGKMNEYFDRSFALMDRLEDRLEDRPEVNKEGVELLKQFATLLMKRES